MKNKTLENGLPEIWHILCTNENLEALKKWSGYKHLDTTKLIGMCKWKKTGIIELGTNPFGITKDLSGDNAYTFGDEITFEQFKTHVLKEPTKKNSLPERWKVKWTPEVGRFYDEQLRGYTYSDGWEVEYVNSHNLSNVSIFSKEKGGRSFITTGGGFPTITIEQFREIISQNTQTSNSTNNTNTEIMEAKKEKIQVTTYLTGNKIFRADGTQKNEVVKEVLLTKEIYVNNVKRDVTIAVLLDDGGEVYTGYSVRNPKYDLKHSPEMAKQIARNRAVNNRTNLTHREGISLELQTKYVLRGIADQKFAEISKGKIEIKGIK